MRAKQNLAALLCAVLAVSCLQVQNIAAQNVEEEILLQEEYEPFTDTSSLSDEDFFGVWDDSAQRWKKKGKINYDYSPDLEETERYVKLGGYTMAKKALLSYYKNRTSIAKPELYSGRNKSFQFLTMRDMYNFTEPFINSFTVDTREYARYEIDLGTSTASGVFMLAAMEKDGDVLSILSKEGDPQRAPRLELYYTTGATKSISVRMDSYTRAYDDQEDYREEVYGSEPEIAVKDGWYQNDTDRYLPYSSKTREGYIAFNSAQIDKTNLLTAKLVVYAKLRPEDGESQCGESAKEIAVFDAYNKAWRETESDSGTYPVLSWENISHNHYSWNGLPGGFDWEKPEGASSEYINYNARFTQIPSLLIPYMETGDTSYLYKSIEFALDFIRDAGAGTPPGRDLEPAQRILELCPAFFYFAESSMFNGEAAVAMLKYMWEEGTFLYEAPVYFNYNNRGLWHTTAFFTLAAYFPEFQDVEIWQPVIDQRLDDIVHTLIGEDGCYNEATFAYPTSILVFLQKLIKACEDARKEPPAFLREKLGLLSRYLMACSYPSGVTAEWGEGGRANARTALKQPAQLLNDNELLYWATNGEEGSVPQSMVFRFDKLKIVTSRTDWSDSGYMIFMNAKNGGYHNHKDSLSLDLYAKDREVLSDTGMTSYDSKHPHFDWQRHQTKSHNTIEIDNTGQRGDTSTLTENGDSAIEVYPSESSDRIMAWTDATAGFRHFRNVTFLKKLKFVIVTDMVHPQDQEQHTYTQNWHTRLQSRVSIDDVTKVGSTNFTLGSNLQIIQSEPENLTASLETGYDSEGQSTTQYFSYKKVQAGDTAFNTVLFPVEEGETSEAVVRTLDTGVSSAVASAMEISVFKQGADRQAVVYYNSHEYGESGMPVPERRSFGPYTSDGANATIVLDADNEVQAMTLCFGTELKRENNVLLESEQTLSSLSVEFEGNTAIVQSADESVDTTKIVIAAPDIIQRVTFNGEEMPMVRQDGKIVVNGTEAPIPTPTPAPTGGLKPGGNASGSVQSFSSGGSVSAAAPTAASAPETSRKPAEETPDFSDIRNHWAEKEIVAMTDAGVVNGRENGVFEPEDEITRAEFAAMAVRATGERAKPYQGEFEDVRSYDWFAAQVQAAWEQGWITGENGIFRPNDGISRQEAAAVLCRMLEEKQPESDPPVFLDHNRFESWAVPYIEHAAALGLMRGMEDGCFAPKEVVTRAQAAVLFYRLRQEWETLQETGLDSPNPAETHKSNSDEESEKEKSL